MLAQLKYNKEILDIRQSACSNTAKFPMHAQKLPYISFLLSMWSTLISSHCNRLLKHSSTPSIIYQHNDKRVKSCISGLQSFKIQSLAQTPSSSHNPTKISENIVVPKMEVHTSAKRFILAPPCSVNRRFTPTASKHT